MQKQIRQKKKQKKNQETKNKPVSRDTHTDFLHFAQMKYNLSDNHAHREKGLHSKMNLVIV